MYKIQNIEDKKLWDDFLDKAVDFYPLFQSWNWGEVQRRMGFDVIRIGIYSQKKLAGVCQIVNIPAKRGHYLHLRHGPAVLPFNHEVFKEIISYCSELAKKKGASFIRLSPVIKKETAPLFSGFRAAPIHNMDAEICWVLDLDKLEDELLKNMRKTHRYLIRKSKDLNIKIIRTKKASDIDNFIYLYKDLSERKHFVPHKGVREEYEVFARDNQAMLFLAEYQGKIISGALVSFVGNMAIYRHGASDANFREIPASYVLQWEAILEAKKRGMKLYNFWGIASTDSKSHPWYGLTLFKTGFGGRKVELIHAMDLPLSLSYWKTYLIESYTKLRKGY